MRKSLMWRDLRLIYHRVVDGSPGVTTEAGRRSEYGNAVSQVPRPVEDGTSHIESLGRLIDNLFGDGRYQAAAAAVLEPLWLEKEEAPKDPPPSEPPPPVPDGTEEIKKGQ